MSVHTPETMRQLSEASEWLARIRSEPESEEALTGWLRWCEADPANAAAFERIQTLWRQMDQLPGVAAEGSRADIEDVEMAAPVQLKALARRRRPAYVVGWSVAAMLVIAVIGADLRHRDTAPVPVTALGTTAPENRVASLPDGSTVHLAAKTSLAVDFGGPARHLRMSSGEAYFKVRPDKKRPFVVRAGALDVTAVGTAFDVKDTEGRISVTVQEGVVTVAPAESPRAWPLEGAWRVGPGYQFQYSEREGTAGLSSVDTSTVLAWREGRLEYVNAPLAQVLADVNRYAREPIEAADPAAGQLTFTGTVFTDSIPGWLEGLPGALPVKVGRAADGHPQIQTVPTEASP